MLLPASEWTPAAGEARAAPETLVLLRLEGRAPASASSKMIDGGIIKRRQLSLDCFSRPNLQPAPPLDLGSRQDFPQKRIIAGAA